MLDRFRRKKKPQGPMVSREEFLRLKPVRNPAVRSEKTEKGDLQLLIPLAQGAVKKGASGKILSKLMPPPPKERKIQLDMVGSLVWELCDGNTTMKDIAGALQEKYKMMQVEAEVSLDAYFKQLTKRGLVGFIVPEDLRERFTEETKGQKTKK